MKVATQCGFRASFVGQRRSAPVVALERGSFQSVAVLRSPVPGTGLFGAASLEAVVKEPSPHAAMPASGHLDGLLSITLVGNDDGRIVAETSLIFDGGVTTDWIAGNLRRWWVAVRKCQRLTRAGVTDRARRSRLVRSRPSIH